MDQFDAAQRRKQEIRLEAAGRRRRQPDAERASEQIIARVAALREYAAAKTVMCYMDFHAEVRTRPFVTSAWGRGKRVAVPYCAGDRLGLFHLTSFDELAPGTMGILEPAVVLRDDPDREIDLGDVDLIVVPGLAFDPECGRVGYGKGYYDRLLHAARPDTVAIGVAYECQIFPEIPVLNYDARLDMVVTEEAIYRRRLPRLADM